MSGTVASAFVVWNNPREHITYEHDKEGNIVLNPDGSKKILSSTPTYLAELSNKEICDTVLSMWCNSKAGRIGAVAYCVSQLGLHHLHMVLESSNSDSDRFRYSAIQKIYGVKFHIEPTRGSKKEAEDYIYKRGKFAEKGEQVLEISVSGDIKGNQGNRSDLAGIESMIMQGMTPNEIMDTSIKLRRYEKIIRDAYYRQREKNTPFVRKVKVVYHVGETETGKTYECEKLMQQLGEDHVYFVKDYTNGFMDKYDGQEILWLDEYRNQFSYATFLSILDVYKCQIHSRYTNAMMLWNEVHITSIEPPEVIYRLMGGTFKGNDTYEQMKRRITTIVYHYFDAAGNRCRYEMDMKEYKDYETLKGCAVGKCDKNGWYKADATEVKGIFR